MGGESGNIGVGFAIPIDEVLPIVDQMAKGETPTHARLGVQVSPVSQDGGATVTDGAQIAEVSAGSTAANAGIAEGDVITKVDDHLIADADSLVATIRSYRPGDQVTVTYTPRRRGEDRPAHARLRLGGVELLDASPQAPTERRRWVSEKGGPRGSNRVRQSRNRGVHLSIYSFFCSSPSHCTGTKPSRSLTATIGAFTSAL